MAVHKFGGTDVENRRGSYPLLISIGTVVELFNDEDGTDPVQNLYDEDGNPLSSVTVVQDSKLPYFMTGVEDQDVLYARVNGGDIVPIYSEGGPPGPAGPPGPPGVVKVVHGDDPDVPRPDAPLVYWVGTVLPNHGDPDDLLMLKEA